MALPLREEICDAERPGRIDEIIMGRAELLGEADKALLEAVIARGQSAASVARMMGVSPRVVRGRVRRLTGRVISRRFLDAARALPYLLPEDARLAQMRFCQGATHRQLCQRFNVTWHCLRRRLDRIAAQVETVRRLTQRHQMEVDR